jgi:hypothetical protein
MGVPDLESKKRDNREHKNKDGPVLKITGYQRILQVLD